MSFRRRNEYTENYEKKIDTMVEKLLRYKWDGKTLKKELLIHCCEDKEIKREIKMREYESSEQITAMMQKFDKIREEDNDRVDTILSYSQVVKGKGNRLQNFREWKHCEE